MAYNQPCDWCGTEPSEHTAEIYYACDDHEAELGDLVA